MEETLELADDLVDARPTKRFFVRMLVRDIELVPAIVDLVDNSVDGAKRQLAQNPPVAPHETSGRDDDDAAAGVHDAREDLSGHRVAIAVSPDSFVIEDDCGGIELLDAVRYAFRFGRLEDVEPVEGEVGQFGVGMKRALFKLGDHFEVTSIAANSRFILDVNVPDWLEQPEPWSFPLKSHSEQGANGDRPGVTVRVTGLHRSVAAEFGEERFMQRLRDQIEFRHQEAITAGLTVELNGHQLRSRPVGLLVADGLVPRVVDKELSSDGVTVRLRLYAGFVELSDEGADTDDPDKFSGGSLAGWYIVCNGRMLLFADKSRLTGWGQEVADYHPQYRRFRGYAYLSGNSAAMPWNTAKTAIDEDSPIWQLVRNEIVAALREARTVMNRIKTEVQDSPEEQRPVSASLKAASQTRLTDLKPSPTLVVPPRPPQPPATTKRIAYSVPVDVFDEVSGHLGEDKPLDVGRRTFDYYYAREIEG